MKLSWRLLQSFRVLLPVIAALFAIMLYLGWATFAELERQRKGPSDSAQWSIFQTSLEFHRLSEAFSLYRAQNSAENLEEFNKRFEIFYSRIQILKTGAALDPYRDETFFISGTAQLTGFVERLSAMVDTKEFEALRTDPSVQQDFRDLEGGVALFITSAVQVQAARSEAIRASLKRLLLLQLITCGCPASALLRQIG
jgi:hypothetical protein